MCFNCDLHSTKNKITTFENFLARGYVIKRMNDDSSKQFVVNVHPNKPGTLKT